MAYLIDTDIFIRAKNDHYRMDVCPGFWEWLIRANAAGRVLSIRAVGDDLSDGDDELTEWAAAQGDDFFVAPAASDLEKLGEVARWIDEHDTYTAAAKQTFLGCSDFYVVAQALAGRHTVVSHEVPSDSVNKVKIPNACIELGIRHATPWQMLRVEQARFVLEDTEA